MRTIIQTLFFSVLAVATARAQTTVERRAILQQFEQTLNEYMRQMDCAGHAPADPSAVIFTLPVSMVFRQQIAQVIGPIDGPTITAVRPSPGDGDRLDGLSAEGSIGLTTALKEALPPLPPGMEYRFVHFDLVVRDAQRDAVIAVLRDAVRHSSAASHVRRQR